VYFPREILPLAVVGAAMVHFVLQLLVLFVSLIAFRYDFVGPSLLWLPLAFVTLTIFMTALGLLLASANVYLRDTQHLLEVVLLFWFWITPIVYPINLAVTKLSSKSQVLKTIYLLNPMANIVIGFQRAIYRHVSVKGKLVLYAGNVTGRLFMLLGISLVLLWFGQRVFARAQGNFAQEL